MILRVLPERIEYENTIETKVNLSKITFCFICLFTYLDPSNRL